MEYGIFHIAILDVVAGYPSFDMVKIDAGVF